MRVEIVAVGTELLLGQIADTNSAWLGEHLAANGVASHFHQAVGDNHDRITLALRTALARSDGVIMCGGLGPTQDDITREAIAAVMNVPLERDQAIVDVIAGFFEARGRTMTDNNARQADVPRGATIIPPLAHQHTLQVATIWFACALTLYTGAEYLLDGRRSLHSPAAP